MNSLTTVGGTVIDAADMQIVNNAEKPEKKHAGSRDASRSCRINARRGRSVDFAFVADTSVNSLDDKGHPLSTKAGAATSLDPASLSRHRSAPANGSTVATYDNEHSSPRPRSYLKNRASASPHCSNMDDRFDDTNLQRNIPRSPTITKVPYHHHHDEMKKSILAILYDVSKSDPYASSEYFRQLFTNGIRNVENHIPGKEGSELKSVQEALRTCFGINEDLIHAIAEDVNTIMERKRVKAESLFGEGRRNNNDDVGSSTTEIVMNSKISIPISPADHSRISESKSSAQHFPHSHFCTPTDLSGYSQRNVSKSGGSKTPKANPSDALTLPLPSTPLNIGKQHTPFSHTLYYESKTDSSHSTSFHFGEVLYNKPVLHVVNNPLSPSERARCASFTPQEQEQDDVTNQNNQKVCSRVEQYLQQLEARIKSVKKGHRTTVIDQSSRDGITENPRRHAPTKDYSTRPLKSAEEWNGAEQNRDVAKSNVKKQLLLPSLMSPGKKDGVKEPSQTSVTFRERHVADETEMDIPLDEVETKSHQHYQRGMYRAGPPTLILSPHDNHSSLICSSEEKVRAAEKSVGLKSLQEYKQLLQERTMELEGLEHKYKTQLEQAERELEGQDEQVKQFRLAMKEAEVTVTALEETIQSLETAVNEKDELIVQLECRVKTLETELEQNQVTKLEGEIQHLDTVTMLNESISQMGMDMKEKETSLFELQSKTTKIEAELSKALEQLATSQADLAAAQKSIVEKDLKLQVSENEVLSTKEMLNGHIELYKTEVSLSLQNTTRLMDLMTKEKDSLIESLNAKIAILEESLAEVEKEKVASSTAHTEKEKELNDKIKKKDEQIAMLQKSKKSEYSSRKTASSSHNHSRKKDERLRSQHHRHSERRGYVPIMKEKYYEPSYVGMHEKKYRFDKGKYYEHSISSMPITREEREREALHSSHQYDGRNDRDDRYSQYLETSLRSRYYKNETRDDDAVSMMDENDDDEYYTTRHRQYPARRVDDHNPHLFDDYTFDGDDSIYDFS